MRNSRSIGKILFFSRLFPKSPVRKNENCVIFGNGPSLKNAIHAAPKFLKDKDLICVNFFPNTALYEEVKPAFFVGCDAKLWECIEQEEDHPTKAPSIALFENLKNKTDWKLTLLIPYQARKWKKWQDLVSKNKLIKIVYYNRTPLSGGKSFLHKFFSMRLGMPRPHNVMIPSIFNTIGMGYKQIFLFGVEHSWLTDIHTNDDNEVMLGISHFYKNDKKPVNKSLYFEQNQRAKYHEILESKIIVFKGYHILEGYAKSKRVDIYNMTEGSHIDAFKRKKLIPSQDIDC